MAPIGWFTDTFDASTESIPAQKLNLINGYVEDAIRNIPKFQVGRSPLVSYVTWGTIELSRHLIIFCSG